MPNIRSSADLRNNYNDISSYCHAYNEPVFITKNGKGDLAVMSMETYEEMAGRIELYSKLQEGLADVEAGNTRPFADVMADLRHRRSADEIQHSCHPSRRARYGERLRLYRSRAKNPTAADKLLDVADEKSEHWQNSRTNLKSFPTNCFPYGESASPSL